MLKPRLSVYDGEVLRQYHTMLWMREHNVKDMLVLNWMQSLW